ncbi:MAG: VCBS repeat-containing protein [Pyrinomonadaceae bacterium]|nr:VCBS repeat-containing protein [Pyrinomonadaceae bacterium]
MSLILFSLTGSRLIVSAAVTLVFMGFVVLSACNSSGTMSPEEVKRLETIEELSESLANDLLDLSIATRDRNLETTREFFSPKLTSKPFPAKPLPAKTKVKWIETHDWESDAAEGPAKEITSKEFLKSWTSFLDHFPEIDDARFKVKEANFSEDSKAVEGAENPTAEIGATGTARIAVYVIGRNTEGKREWARAMFRSNVRAAANKRWQFNSIEMMSIESMVAKTDLFSEVNISAGVEATAPAFGTPENSSFVWRGAVAADFNNDGWVDLFVTSEDRNFLYLNDKKGRFEDVSEKVGVKLAKTGTAPLALDYDNDGDSDVFISAIGNQLLLENKLNESNELEFEDVSLTSGVSQNAFGFSAVAGDVNADGKLDIYVTSYNDYGRVPPDSWFRATNGTKNLLLVNQGDGTFLEEAAKWGVDDGRWSYAAEFADINGDGRIDLFVANDFGEKAMFINKGDRFVDEASERGVLDPANGMGVSFGDYNNDGKLDLHTTNMSSTAGNRILSRLFPDATAKDNVLKKLASGNNLFENLGDGKFKDVTEDVGGFSGGWAWGGGFLDFDNDGWEDIYTPNGFISGKSMKDT